MILLLFQRIKIFFFNKYYGGYFFGVLYLSKIGKDSCCYVKNSSGNL